MVWIFDGGAKSRCFFGSKLSGNGSVGFMEMIGDILVCNLTNDGLQDKGKKEDYFLVTGIYERQ